MEPDRECPIDAYNVHIAAFVKSFVKRERRERWLHLLTNRPKQLMKNSHKLHNHLDKSRCRESPHPSLDPFLVGMYCDFCADSPPLIVTTRRAIEIGSGHDAIFSADPGRTAIFFFHEDCLLECQA